MNKFEEEYQKKQNIEKEMEKLKYETARELGIDSPDIPNGANVTSRNIGLHAGPVGGEMVKKLVAQAQAQLINQSNKNY